MSIEWHRQIGFTLIEVLIAVVVIAIGLLGLAGLQATGISNSHISSLRSMAAIHTENMAELMRANIEGVNDNAYATLDYSGIDPDAAPDPTCRAPADLCIADEQAQADAFHWIRAIDRDLPAPAGAGIVRGRVVCHDRDAADAAPDADICTDGSSHTITVSWREKDLEAMVDKSFATVFRP